MTGRKKFFLRFIQTSVVLILNVTLFEDTGLSDDLLSTTSPQNAADFNHPKTTYMIRLGLVASDEVGGPTKYNTRFPTTATQPNPASFYRGLGKTLLHLEAPYEQKGAFVLGIGKKFDWSRRKMDDQFTQVDNMQFKLQQFRQSTVSTYFGWSLGQTFVESPWSVHLLVGYDQSQIDFSLNSRESEGTQETLRPISYVVHSTYFLSKLLRNLGSYSFVSCHAGLHASIPLFQQVKRGGERDVPWLDERFDIRSLPGIGLTLMVSSAL